MSDVPLLKEFDETERILKESVKYDKTEIDKVITATKRNTNENNKELVKIALRKFQDDIKNKQYNELISISQIEELIKEHFGVLESQNKKEKDVKTCHK